MFIDKVIEKGKELFKHKETADTTNVSTNVVIGQGSDDHSTCNHSAAISVPNDDIVENHENSSATTQSSGEVNVVSSPKVSLPHEKEKEPAPLTFKEEKALKKAGYEKIMEEKKFKKIFVLKNKKTNQIAEIRAASSFHACNIIGWKSNKVVIIQEKEAEE